jgi:thioredoxin-like negative regulator of GroEL
MAVRSVVLALVLCFVWCGDCIVTIHNFEEVIDSGKNVFILLYARKCKHSQQYLPFWEDLITTHANSTTLTVDKFDCSGEMQSLCVGLGLSGMPTLKYWYAGDPFLKGRSYKGNRDHWAVERFVNDDLSKLCQASDRHSCNEKELKFLATIDTKTPAEVHAELQRLMSMQEKKMSVDTVRWLRKRIFLLKGYESDDMDVDAGCSDAL